MDVRTPGLHAFATDERWQQIANIIENWSASGGSELVVLNRLGKLFIDLDLERGMALMNAEGITDAQIRALPDMLAALKRLVNLHSDAIDGAHTRHAVSQARTAITKAENTP